MLWGKKRSSVRPAAQAEMGTVLGVVLETLTEVTPRYQQVFDIQAGDHERTRREWDYVNLDVTLFVLHLLDVCLFIFAGEQTRDTYFPNILTPIATAYEASAASRYGPAESDASFMNLYRATNLHYSQFRKLAVENDAPKEGVLSWEVAKQMCKAHGVIDAPAVLTLTVLNQDAYISLLSGLRTARIIPLS